MAAAMFDTWPGKIYVAPGASDELCDILKGMGKSRVMFITDTGLKDFDWVKNMVQKLRDGGFEVAFFGEIGPNPVTGLVEAARDVMLELKPDVIVALGGGSPIDAAKAANVIYTYGGGVKDYGAGGPSSKKIGPGMLTLVAIPTTAGTGSEVSQISVITDAEAQIKFGLMSNSIVPDVVILDANLTLTLPKSMTAFTGIDALTHCIEAYVSTVDFAPGKALALHGIRMIKDALPRAYADGGDLKAREEMLMASFLGGMSFSTCMLGACHACAHVLSAVYNTPHGLANAVLLPEIMKVNKPACASRLADIAQAMGGDVRGLSEDRAADLAIELVADLCARVGIPKYLDDIGVKREDLDMLAGKAIMDGCIFTNPVPGTLELVTRIYTELFRDPAAR